ncbi:NADPH-dependent F420 reductase [Caballeronia sp. SEWSISQ10-4 2]|uniref:NADPH-dependent F420 reductase n=1 Tax=Caballeronia sp. SEWSISQ10-4 2 TaxID=2937438 RepID=UPI0026588EFA|nr:NAD(P)-binding domain-containing protein [Caballeronia sp. SEWSISQ10-4 2]
MKALNISILGTGDMGGAIATAISRRTRHLLRVRGSQPGSASARRLIDELGVAEATDQDFLASDIVFVVVPAAAIEQAAAILNNYRGIVVAVSVSGSVGQDGLPSAAARMAALLPDATLVSAFTSIWSNVIREPGRSGKTSVFVCSDEDNAKDVVSGLANELGFEPVNGGKLAMALYAEMMGIFAVRLAIDSGYGRKISFHAFRAE